MTRHNFNSFEDFENENITGLYEDVSVIREKGWFKADLMTETKSVKVALNRFFRMVPELSEWKESLIDAPKYGIYKDNSDSFHWEIDFVDRTTIYIFLNVKENVHLA